MVDIQNLFCILGGRIVQRTSETGVSPNADIVPEDGSALRQWCKLTFHNIASCDQSTPLKLVYATTGEPIKIQVQGVFVEGELGASDDDERPKYVSIPVSIRHRVDLR